MAVCNVAPYRPKFDLSAFVQGLMDDADSVTLPELVETLDHEVEQTEGSLARDAHMRFAQLRYVNSLKRVGQMLRTGQVPADLTPRERLAIRALHIDLKEVPDSLAEAFEKVTLPPGVFGESFYLQHRLAS